MDVTDKLIPLKLICVLENNDIASIFIRIRLNLGYFILKNNVVMDAINLNSFKTGYGALHII